MSQGRLRVAGGAAATVGALCWLAKLSAIVVTGGDIVDTGAAALFYLLGVVVLAIGGALAGLWLTAGRALLLRIVGVIVGVFGFFVSFMLLDSIGGGVIGERGPEYARDELGILLTPILWLVPGLWMWLGTTRVPKLEPGP